MLAAVAPYSHVLVSQRGKAEGVTEAKGGSAQGDSPEKAAATKRPKDRGDSEPWRQSGDRSTASDEPTLQKKNK